MGRLANRAEPESEPPVARLAPTPPSLADTTYYSTYRHLIVLRRCGQAPDATRAVSTRLCNSTCNTEAGSLPLHPSPAASHHPPRAAHSTGIAILLLSFCISPPETSNLLGRARLQLL